MKTKGLFKPASPEMVANRPPLPPEKPDWGFGPAVQVISMVRASEMMKKAFDDHMYAKFILGIWQLKDHAETCAEAKLRMRSEHAF